MRTISVSQLKSRFCAELKEVEKGASITVLDHKRPVAVLSPIETETLFVKEAGGVYAYTELTPLTLVDPLGKLEEERTERW